jgi:entericidin B
MDVALRPSLLRGRRSIRAGNLSPDADVESGVATSNEGTQMAKALTRTRAELALLSVLTALFFMMLTLSGCNTVEGMGEDVSAAGGAMSDTADDVKDEM